MNTGATPENAPGKWFGVESVVLETGVESGDGMEVMESSKDAALIKESIFCIL